MLCPPSLPQPQQLFHVRETLLAWIHMAGHGVLGSRGDVGDGRGGGGGALERPPGRSPFVEAGERSSQRGN